jgi:Type II secretion system (T2SS), protein M subtype b
MTTGTFDRKSLLLLAGGVTAILVLWLALPGNRQPAAGAVIAVTADSIPATEKRLERMRAIAASVPAREEMLKQALADLAAREKGVMKADTAPQAQAQLIDLVQTIAKANGIDSHGVERMDAKVVSKDYGEVSVEVAFTCGIEQLVNLLASLADQPQILSTNEIRVNGGADKNKNIEVRLGVTALVTRKLLPEKKGAAGL